MATNLSKYIKLSTQQWTGNGTTNPTETITIDGKEGSSSVTLSQENSELYLNNVPVSAGGGGVSSITATLPLTVSQSVGEVVIDMNAFSDVDEILGGPGVAVNQSTGDVTLSTTGGLTSLTAGSLNLTITFDPQTKIGTISTGTSISQATPPSYNIQVTSAPMTFGPLSPPSPAGLYLLVLFNSRLQKSYLFPARRWSQAFQCGDTLLLGTSFNNQDTIRAYTRPVPLSDDQLYIVSGSGSGSGLFAIGDYIQINYFKIL
jgi:hypothetical protein